MRALPLTACITQDMWRYTNQDFGEKAYQALLLLIGSQRCSLDDLASHFSIHPRTLNCRLKEAGTRYRKFHNEAHHQTTCQLLRDTPSGGSARAGWKPAQVDPALIRGE